jgi:hypothetical protein
MMSLGQAYRTLSAAQLRAWAEDHTQVIRLRSNRDLLPAGHLAARVPVMVEWRTSRLAGEAPYAILRNVNYGGSLLERTTVLHSIRMPLDGVEFVEFTLVPLGPGGRRGPVQHGHLRFVFKPDQRPQLLSLEGAATGADASIDDLVLSWEPWRYKDDGFNFIKALGDDFDLTLRAYAGAQRYLEDVLEGHEWHSYRLVLPGGATGVFELLKVALVLGDGAARQVLSRLFAHAETAWLEEAPPREGESDLTHADWQALRQRIEQSERPAFDAPALGEQELTYQTLVRSCAALARYTVLLTARRLVERGLTDGIDPRKLPESTLGVAEAWMQTAPGADLRGLFMQAPRALRFIGRHPQCVPSRIPGELDAAGLLARRNGRPWRLHFAPKALQPYDSEGVRRFEIEPSAAAAR